MHIPGKIKDLKKIIHTGVREVHRHGVGDIGGSCKKFAGSEKRAERGTRFLKTVCPAELRRVLFGSAAQSR